MRVFLSRAQAVAHEAHAVLRLRTGQSAELPLELSQVRKEIISLAPALPLAGLVTEPARSTHLQLGVLAAPHQALREEETGITGPSGPRLRKNKGQSSPEN